ncbi:MAG: 2-amino-4-hydroxy-6-hydroxymethyldihydropteridine diphosphokinase [Candidatus Omnitrophota bacterium]
MPVCYLGIGSNLGDRRENIRKALQEINKLKGTKVIKASRIIETNPIDCPEKQGKYLNAALKIKTGLKPLSLLRALKKIEQKLGRPGKHLPNSPRQIDLDILFYADKVIRTKNLIIPHPKMFEREFVIKPLSEII